jgi:ABC-type glycerol-3-phosphate transport system permease component
VTVYIPLVLIMIVLLFPFYWMVLTAIKPDEQLLDLEKFNPFWSSRRPSSIFPGCCSRRPIRAGSGTRC